MHVWTADAAAGQPVVTVIDARAADAPLKVHWAEVEVLG